MEGNNFRIGILGGMGPMAGVWLQRLIIESTPAEKDQEHLQVFSLTNPQIPDRTDSLKNDGGEKYVAEVINSLRALEQVGVNLILIPCHTAHARFSDIGQATSVPILNMIEITKQKIEDLKIKRIGLLASDGTISSGIFTAPEEAKLVLLEEDSQKRLMQIIYEIKAGKYSDIDIASDVQGFLWELKKKGAEKTILGCTELSLYTPHLEKELIIDPLNELAKKAVYLAGQWSDKSIKTKVVDLDEAVG